MAETIHSSPDASVDTGANGGGTDGRAGGSTPATTRPDPNSVVGAATRVASTHAVTGAVRESAGRPAGTDDARPLARARQIVGQLAALPRLARGADARAESVAERIARRRRAAQATLNREASTAETDWARVGVFGAGVVIGALIGAGAALLLAPATGYDTRSRLARRARAGRGWSADQWDQWGDMSDDVRDRARHGAKRLKRAGTGSRHAGADDWERRRRD